jgi:hypothetical protein
MTENQQPFPHDPAQPYGYPAESPGYQSSAPPPPPPPGGYGSPPYIQPVQPPMSVAAIASFVLGLASIFGAFLLVPPLVAIVTGIYGLKETKAGKRGKWMAVTGLTIGSVISLLVLVQVLNALR